MHSASFRMWALGPSPETAKGICGSLPGRTPYSWAELLDLGIGLGICFPLSQNKLSVNSLGLAILNPLPKKGSAERPHALPQIGLKAPKLFSSLWEHL